jgi:hypothetical protein
MQVDVPPSSAQVKNTEHGRVFSPRAANLTFFPTMLTVEQSGEQYRVFLVVAWVVLSVLLAVQIAQALSPYLAGWLNATPL